MSDDYAVPGIMLDHATQDPSITDGPAEKCPTCGAKTICGYGLAGGGMGAYTVCSECDWMGKEQDEPSR